MGGGVLVSHSLGQDGWMMPDPPGCGGVFVIGLMYQNEVISRLLSEATANASPVGAASHPGGACVVVQVAGGGSTMFLQ